MGDTLRLEDLGIAVSTAGVSWFEGMLLGAGRRIDCGSAEDEDMREGASSGGRLPINSDDGITGLLAS